MEQPNVPLEFQDLVKLDFDPKDPMVSDDGDAISRLFETAKISGGVEGMIARGSLSAEGDLRKAAPAGKIRFEEQTIEGVRFRIGYDSAGVQRYQEIIAE